MGEVALICGYCLKDCNGDAGVDLGDGVNIPLHHEDFYEVPFAPNGRAVPGFPRYRPDAERRGPSCYDLVTVFDRPLADGRRWNNVLLSGREESVIEQLKLW